jgi:hypothetical protein
MSKSIALMFVASALLLAGCCTSHHVTQWEYMNLTITASMPDQSQSHPTLNELGKEGWVVVGFAHESGGPHENEYYRYVLKRKLQ